MFRSVWKALISVLSIAALLVLSPSSTMAAGFGVHVLQPEELGQTASLFDEYRQPGENIFVTIPFTLDHIDQLDRWQQAFDEAKKHQIVPIVRLTTRFDPELNAWIIPNREQIVRQITALNQLDWPQKQRHVIVYNEPNHDGEWGGQVDARSFAYVSRFAIDWLQTESADYVVLPAALDLAAPDGPKTQEAFGFWDEVLAVYPDYFDRVDAWNSHSYPNPGFVSAPSRTGQNSLRGFEHELAYLQQHSDRTWKVFITETGWRNTPQVNRTIASYYRYAGQNIWSHEQVVAVTPFLLNGSPGPFAEFSFLHADGQPTNQWQAFASWLDHRNSQLLTQR